MLHITNGDAAAAAMKRAQIAGDILPWRDVLHEGPVPSGLTLREMSEIRAQFIADSGWGSLETVQGDFRARNTKLESFQQHEEVVLWFEHDLYDQLQLLQVLNWFSEQTLGKTRLSIMSIDEYFGTMAPERLAALHQRRSNVTSEQMQLAGTAWAAFCSPNPTDWQQLTMTDTSDLPFLGATILRHMEQYPSVQNGTNRTENTLLNVIVQNRIETPREIFEAVQAFEESRFMGDMVFWKYLKAMTQSDPPLLEMADGGIFHLPDPTLSIDDFQEQRLLATENGKRVLNDELDWIEINGIDKWLGGVHLEYGNSLWRWDSDERELVQF